MIRSILILVCVVFSACDFRTTARNIILHPPKTGITTVRYFDDSRARPVVTEIWYPVEDSTLAKPVAGMWVRCPEARDAPLKKGKYPLVLMSHGNGGDRLNGAWLAEILASNGFIVAAMDHHGNTWNNKIAEGFVKIWERPKDISYVIDQLLKDPQLSSVIDEKRIGFIGYSLGGQTGVWIAGGKMSYFDKPNMSLIPVEQVPNFVTKELIESIDFSPAHQSYRDPRVGAVFLMAPALGFLFDPVSLQNIQIPVYIVAPEGDQIVPPEKNGKLLATKIKKAFYSLIPGSANHYVFLNEVSKGGKMILDTSVATDPPSVDRSKIHEEVGSAAVNFFFSYLR